MAINTEWSDFRAPSLPLLPEDVALDAASNKPGFQIYEKLISGMYLGGDPCAKAHPALITQDSEGRRAEGRCGPLGGTSRGLL